MDKIVLFGAGKIGRSFIGQLFSRSGYECVFVDLDQTLVDQLNAAKRYKVVIKEEEDEVIWVEHVRAVVATDSQKVAEEIADSSIVAVSVGQRGLPKVAPVIAKALLMRYAKDPLLPLDIILAENLRNADRFMFNELRKHLPPDYPHSDLLGLVETSIGKMVPIMRQSDLEADPLQVFAEAYNSLILDAKAFKNPIPDVDGLAPKQNMKAWVDRKAFIHNLGHAAAAYLGYLYHPEYQYLYEVLAVKDLHRRVCDTMLEAGNVLRKLYPGEFTEQAITEHIDDLLTRFANRALGDTVYRVGCDLPRKLSANDRLVAPMMKAVVMDMPYENILKALIAGFQFRATDQNNAPHPNDRKVVEAYNKGLAYALSEISGIDTTQYPEVLKQGSLMVKKI